MLIVPVPNAGTLEAGLAEPDAVRYFEFHRDRYRFLIEALTPFLCPHSRVLDIGLCALPRILRQRFPDVRLSTLGFADLRYWTPGEWPHFECNLNDTGFRWADVGTYDVIILAEVLEHLYTAPQIVLRSLRSVLEPGGRLVVQTPNAASMAKRISLLFGSNPFEMIRENALNPGHYREYTVSELVSLARETGFSVSSLSVQNYFRPSSIRARVSGRIGNLLPQGLRDGITAIFQANGSSRTISR